MVFISHGLPEQGFNGRIEHLAAGSLKLPPSPNLGSQPLSING